MPVKRLIVIYTLLFFAAFIVRVMYEHWHCLKREAQQSINANKEREKEMADRKHRYENRTKRPYRRYIIMVEGYQCGVPFRTFYKTERAAERDAIETGGTLIDLRTLKRKVPVKRMEKGGVLVIDWRDA